MEPLLDYSFQSLVQRLCVLGTKCAAIKLRLEMDGVVFEEVLRSQAEFDSAKRRFAETISRNACDLADSECWVYALPLE